MNLNEMQLFNNFLKGEIFVRKQDLPTLQTVMKKINEYMKIASGHLVAIEANKYPTYFIRNSFTGSSQEIV